MILMSITSSEIQNTLCVIVNISGQSVHYEPSHFRLYPAQLSALMKAHSFEIMKEAVR